MVPNAPTREGAPAPGSVLAGKYRVERLVGSGGMGIVVAATHVHLHEPVAIKLLRPEAARRPGAVERFLREARVVMRLRGEHVVRIHDVGTLDDGAPFIVMEYLEGCDLGAHLRSGGPMRIADAVDAVLQACEGIAEAHAMGVVHRDLKPANLFLAKRVDGSPCVKVLDFGVSKVLFDGFPTSSLDGETLDATLEPENQRAARPFELADTCLAAEPRGGTNETRTNALMGSPRYMAPEQIRSARHVDARADVWSLGVILYELVSSERPFDGDDFDALTRAILHGEPAALHVADGAPPQLKLAIDACLAKNLEARHRDVLALAEALAPLASAEMSAAPRRIARILSAGARRARASGGAETPVRDDERRDRNAEEGTGSSQAATHGKRASEVAAKAGVLRKTSIALVIALAAGAVLVAAPAWRDASRGGARAMAGASSAVAIAQLATSECSSNRDCLRAHGDEAWRCKLPAGVCVPLASPDCTVLAERSDLENDATVWIGAMFPVSGEEGKVYGLSNQRAVELARRDFASSLGRFAHSDPLAIHPIGVVACDDIADARRAAAHLVDDVGAVGVIGFRNSSEVVDLAATVFIPRSVVAVAALNTGAAVTALPQPTGEPRLVWRTTYNMTGTAAPLSAFVHDVLEPRVLAAPARGAVAPVRVALIRSKNGGAGALSAELRRTLVFNGVSATANRETYLEIAYDDPLEHAAAPDWQTARRDLLQFAPHIVLFQGDDTLVTNVIAPLEASWPAHAPRPIYATMHNLAPAVFSLIGKDPSRRRRFFGITSVSTIDTNAKFVTHYNETFAEKITRTVAPNTSYDAFYLLAYGVHALGDRPPTGPNLARALTRLMPPGKPVDVGPADIFDAYKTLAAGKNIDLDGAIGKLDFDVETGEAPVDMAILCVNVDHEGRAFDTVESGLVYDAATKKLTGAMRCP